MKKIGSGKNANIFLTEDFKILKKGKRGHPALNGMPREADIQRKAHELGVAPKVYANTQNTITMEYIDGLTLLKYIGNKSEVERKRLYAQIRQKVDLLYDNNINHRDLNYNNILVTEEGRIYIIDYGYSKIEKVFRRNRHYPLKF